MAMSGTSQSCDERVRIRNDMMRMMTTMNDNDDVDDDDDW